MHISSYFYCIFFAYSTNTVYIIAYFLHISCILLAYTCIFKGCLVQVCNGIELERITAYNMHIQTYFWHIPCISFAFFTNTVYSCAYFVHFLHITAYSLHISAGSIPASPVQGCSCTIPASPTTTGSCALVIAGKLMRVRAGMANPGRRPDRPTGPPHRAAGRHDPQRRRPLCRLRSISLAPAAGQSSKVGRIYMYMQHMQYMNKICKI